MTKHRTRQYRVLASQVFISSSITAKLSGAACPRPLERLVQVSRFAAGSGVGSVGVLQVETCRNGLLVT